ncbi:V-type proton ATPase subunit e 2 [Manduca sexta]|uniref:V-type proton ATPase subunit n=1 Tax=Manduca sexta TaxID=7130 RepID=A0A921Z4Q5_MANSE|nr:V-type proton ATPase subunit e 2 [Manduca sexta]KAG6450354.1 hypothetical protein O3G_MSEX006507 [Manduca sexta]
MFGGDDGVFSFAGSGSGDGDTDPDSMLETFYTPIYVLTAVFGAIFVIGPIFARKAKNKDVVITSIMIGAFSMWLFWVTVYIAQMNPLMGPRLANTTLAWMAYAWGNPAKGEDGY